MSEQTVNGRRYPRTRLTNATLPGRLITDAAAGEPQAHVVDVSPQGLGLELRRPMTVGSHVWLILPDRGIKLQVRHCNANDDGSYRCGLESMVAWENMLAVFNMHPRV